MMLSLRFPVSTLLRVSLVCLLALFISGCSDEEDVLSPDGQITPPYSTSPRNTWADLQWSVDNGSHVGWSEAIHPDFEYIPDPVCMELNPGFFENWAQGSEVEFAQCLFGSEFSVSGVLLPESFEIPDPVSDTVEWVGVEYWLEVSSADNQMAVSFGGRANIRFKFEGNFWYLVSWVDLEGIPASWNPEIILPTLGELRLVLTAGS